MNRISGARQGWVGAAAVLFSLMGVSSLADLIPTPGLFIEGEDFDNLPEYEIWQPQLKTWYAKEHHYRQLGHSFAVADEGAIGAVMQKTLEVTLPAGTYQVWLKVVALRDSDDEVEVDLNGEKVLYAWNAKLGFGYRYIKKEITTRKEGNLLTIKLLKANSRHMGEIPDPDKKMVVMDAVYIGDAKWKVEVEKGTTFDELRIGEGKPKEEKKAAYTPTVKAGNILENGSFETGFYGWGTDSTMTPLNASFLDEKEKVHGRYSLKSNYNEDKTSRWGACFWSKNYWIDTPGKYSLSAYFKGKEGVTVTLALGTAPKIWEFSSLLSNSMKCSNAWQRCVATGELKPGLYHIRISRTGDFWVDAVQMEKGDPTDYQLNRDLEAGLMPESEVPGKAYFHDEKVQMKLAVAGGKSYVGKSMPIEIDIFDLWGKVLSKKIPVALGNDQRKEEEVDLTPNRYGMFRAEVKAPASTQEIIFSVVPRPDPMGIDHESAMGVMPEFNEYILSSLQRAGFKWAQDIRYQKAGFWCQAEPEQGKIIWHDEEITLPKKYGMEPVVLLHLSYSSLPKWVEPSPENKYMPKDISLWGHFVYETVKHYKGKVKYWQFSDDIHHWWTWEEHALGLKTAYDAAKKADPDCTFIGWCYFQSKYPLWEESMKRTEPCSDILYSADKFLKNKYKKPVHSYGFIGTTTFYNFPCLGNEETIASYEKRRRSGCSRRAKQYLDFIHSLGGLSRGDAFFLYMAFLPGEAPFAPDSGYSTFEYDGSLNGNMVAFTMINHFVNKAKYLGRPEMARGVDVYLFEKEKRLRAMLFSLNGEERKMTFPFNEAVRFCDGMGNEFKPVVAQEKITVAMAETPVILETAKLPAEDFAKWIQSAEIREVFSLKPRMVLSGKHLCLALDIQQHTGKDLRVEMETTSLYALKDRFATKVVIDKISDGEKKTVSYPLRYGLSRNIEFKDIDITVKADVSRRSALAEADGITFRKELPLWVLASRQQKGPMKLDGTLDDWQGIQPIKIVTTHVGSPTRDVIHLREEMKATAEELTQKRPEGVRSKEDISARVYSRWDDTHLYVAAEVLDDQVEEKDAVDFFFAVGEKVFPVVFTVGTQKIMLKEGDKPIEGVYKKMEKGYVLEAKIPWSELNYKPETGAILKFDVSLTDVDGGARHAELVWSGAPYKKGDPEGFGWLVLGE